jgi:hypothetical protein
VRYALLLLLLGAPTGRQWSEVHRVGLVLPATWKVVERDKENRAFVIEGPKLGPGTPRVVVWDGGPAGIALDKRATQMADLLKKRPGWKLVARQRKQVGPYPVVRFGLEFGPEERRARARFSVLLMGDRFYLLEMSAAASHFPGKTFDKLEASLDRLWPERKVGALKLCGPDGWTFKPDGARCSFTGPSVVVRLGPGEIGPDGVPGAKAGPRLKFLGKTCPTHVAEREIDGEKIRWLHVAVSGHRAAVSAPVALWDDIFPQAEAILARAGRIQPK